MTRTALQIVAAMYDAERAEPAVRGDFDYGRRVALRDVMEALKKEPMDQASTAAVKDFVDRLAVIGDYLVAATGEHTCGTGPDGHYGAHEPGCGYEPITPLDQIRIATR